MANEHTFTLTEPEMMQTSFDKPRITISGLRIPQMPTKDVLAELRCIPHLKKLRSVKMDDIHNCVVLISEDKDTGYMAAAYLAARHGGVYRDDLLNVSELAEDKFEDDPFDASVFEPDEEFLQEGCLPIYPLCPSQNIFEEMGERGPDGDDHVTIRRGRRRKVQNWAEADSAHPILIIPNIITYNAVPKIEAQHNMRSLTIVLLHRPKKNRTNTEDYDSSGLAEELRFACAAEVVDLTTPAPDCQYNQAIFTQSLAAHGMRLAPAADAGAMLRRLEQYRERCGGAGNRNIVALARLAGHQIQPLPPGADHRPGAGLPAARVGEGPRTAQDTPQLRPLRLRERQDPAAQRCRFHADGAPPPRRGAAHQQARAGAALCRRTRNRQDHRRPDAL